jgi:hypothetical protein
MKFKDMGIIYSCRNQAATQAGWPQKDLVAKRDLRVADKTLMLLPNSQFQNEIFWQK